MAVLPWIGQESSLLGYPLWSGFNINQLYFRAYAWMLIPPLMFLMWSPPAPATRSVNFPPVKTNVFIFIEIGSVAALMGFHAYWFPQYFWMAALLIPAIYIGAIILVRIFSKPHFLENSRFMNAACALLSPLTLSAASHSTRLVLDGKADNIAWFSWNHCLVFICLLIVWAFFLRRRRPIDWTWSLCLSVTIPFLVFLFHTSVPPLIPKLNADFHHPGEILVPAHWILSGLFPWKDIVLHQGLLADPIKAWVGMFLLQPTWWGVEAGEKLFLIPLVFILSYLLRARLYRDTPFFVLLATFVLPILMPHIFGRRVAYYERLLLYPLFLIVLFQALSFKRTACRNMWFYVLGGLCAFMILLTPELLLLCISLLLLLSFRSIHAWFINRQVRGELLDLFSTVIGFALVGGLILVWLNHHHALGPFIDSFRYFENYRFVYGMAIRGANIPYFRILLMVPHLIVGVFICVYALRTRSGSPVSSVEWTMGCGAIFIALYYQKFLNQADDHLYAIIFCALPILEFCLWRCWLYFKQIQNFSNPLKWLVLAVLIPLPLYVPSIARHYPNKFTTMGDSPYINATAGPMQATAKERIIIEDFKRLFDDVLEPHDPVLDLTNASFLFHFLIPRPFVERYPQSITLVTPKAQADALASLEQVRPKVVIFERRYGFDVSYPVPMNIRVSSLSSYVLANYSPWLELNGFQLLKRNDWNPRFIPRFSGEFSKHPKAKTCALGMIPHFKATSRSVGEKVGFVSELQNNGLYRTHILQFMPKNVQALEISFDSVEADHWSIMDGEKPLASFISGEGRDLAYRIDLSACLSWKLTNANDLSLIHRKRQGIRSIGIIRNTPELS